MVLLHPPQFRSRRLVVTSGGEIRNFMTLEPIDSTFCDGPGSWQALVQVSFWSLFGTFRAFSSSWDDRCGLLARDDHLRGWSIGLHLFVRRLVRWLVSSPSAEFDEFLVPGEEVARVCLDSISSIIELANDVAVSVP